MLIGTSAPGGVATLPFHAHASVWLVIAALAAFFWWSFTAVGPRLVLPGEQVATRRQKAWIVAGIASMWIWAEYPLHDIAERYLFLVHMLQHTFYTLVAPACLLLGSPPWMWRWLLSKRPIHLCARVFCRPLLALVVFNALIAVTHWPKIVVASTHNELLHFTLHTVLFFSALAMWFPVINRLDGYTKLKAPTKMAYLFAQSIVPTVPASFLAMSNGVMYSTYRDAARLIPGMTAIADQQIAAAIMKLGGGTLLWSVVGYLFFNWWKDSEAGRADDNVKRPRPVYRDPNGIRTLAGNEVLTWADVEAELSA